MTPSPSSLTLLPSPPPPLPPLDNYLFPIKSERREPPRMQRGPIIRLISQQIALDDRRLCLVFTCGAASRGASGAVWGLLLEVVVVVVVCVSRHSALMFCFPVFFFFLIPAAMYSFALNVLFVLDFYVCSSFALVSVLLSLVQYGVEVMEATCMGKEIVLEPSCEREPFRGSRLTHRSQR